MKNIIIYEDISNILKNKNINWYKFKNKSFLVAGANSFLANYIILLLIRLNFEKKLNIKLYLISKNKKKIKKKFITAKTKKFIKIIKQDINSKINFNYKIDYALHLASYASPKYFSKKPIDTALPNILGTYNLLKICTINKIKSFLFFSSGEIYGKSNKKLIENKIYESDNLNLRASYSESKKMGETLCYSFFKQKKVPIKIIRLFHTYGPGMNLNDGRVMMDFVRDALFKNKIIIKSKGDQKRTFLYISDALQAIFIILLKGKNGEAYNVGNPFEVFSINSLAKLIARIHKKTKIIYKNRKKQELYSQSKLKSLVPSIKKLSLLGFKLNVTTKNGFARTLDYFKSENF